MTAPGDDPQEAAASLPLWGETIRIRRIGAIALWENTCEPASEIPLHAHEQTCLTVSFAGYAREHLGTRAIDHIPGAFYCRPAGQEHRFVIGPDRVRCVNIALEPQWLSRLPDLHLQDLEDADGHAWVGVWTAARLSQELQEWSVGSALAVEGMILEMIGLADSNHDRIDSTMPAWIGRAEELLRAELDQGLSMSELAERVGVDPLILSRTWRRFKGCSPAHYANRLRIERATALILGGESSLRTVAAACGFSHATRFSRIFQEITGVTPMSLRNLCR